jgi:hypothetical protein
MEGVSKPGIILLPLLVIDWQPLIYYSGTKLNCGLHDCPQSVTSYLTIPRCSAARLLSGLVVEITKLHDHAFSNKIYALAATKKTKKPNGDGSEIWNSMLRGRLN